jgi:hypothetical protein
MVGVELHLNRRDTMSNQAVPALGSGHPNKILQVDYAGPHAGEWVVRLETLIPIPNEMVDQVKQWLASSEEADAEDLADYLVSRVPAGEATATSGQIDAKHMVAAAFGQEYPDADTRRVTRS